MAEFFHQGGVMMFVGVLVFVGVLAACIVQLALGGRKSLVPFVVAGVALQLLVGGLGTALGFSNSFAAVAMVDPSMKAAILAAGIAESLNNATLALVFAAIETILGGVAAFRHVNARSGRAGA